MNAIAAAVAEYIAEYIGWFCLNNQSVSLFLD